MLLLDRDLVGRLLLVLDDCTICSMVRPGFREPLLDPGQRQRQ
jgi:hypothetical protein